MKIELEFTYEQMKRFATLAASIKMTPDEFMVKLMVEAITHDVTISSGEIKIVPRTK